jgi:hypothetical protein
VGIQHGGVTTAEQHGRSKWQIAETLGVLRVTLEDNGDPEVTVMTPLPL